MSWLQRAQRARQDKFKFILIIAKFSLIITRTVNSLSSFLSADDDSLALASAWAWFVMPNFSSS